MNILVEVGKMPGAEKNNAAWQVSSRSFHDDRLDTLGHCLLSSMDMQNVAFVEHNVPQFLAV